MTKWILIAAAVVGLLAFSLWQKTSTKSAYVNGLAEFSDLPGREYIFERDCYIFKFTDHNTTYPLVGANDPSAVCHVPELPIEVNDAQIDKKIAGVHLLDVVRIGSRFKLVSVRQDTAAGRQSITFEILFADEALRRYPRLDAYYLLDHSPEAQGKPPVFVDVFAVQRVKR